MKPKPAERRAGPSALGRRFLVTVVVLAPLVVLGVSRAALRGPVRHPHGDFKEDCALCHDAKGWKPAKISAKFDHGRYGFTLAGAHAASGCRSCHASLEFRGASATCIGCHEDPHRGELGMECGRCHGSRSFVDRGPMVRAHLMTRLPLVGQHAAVECESCHPPAAQGHMQFVNTPADCQSCHLADYDAARNPDHRGGGFSTDCARCHTAMGWNSARFDHQATAFPLTGAHRTVACASCHAGGVYDGLNTSCVSCHRPDYDGTANPAHAAAGFGTECQSCHTTTNWSASFDHDGRFFPIYSGRHRNEWSACADCHTNPTNYTEFNCLGCHPHSDRAETDGHHREESGYRYDSASCYSCHPRGNS